MMLTFRFTLVVCVFATVRVTRCDEIMENVARLCSQFCVLRPKDCQIKKESSEPNVYAPMDKIVGSKTPATGGVEITLRGFPKPSIEPGLFGNSIYLANTQTYDDKFIDLGYLRGSCVDNLQKCENGLTFSLWYWVSDINHPWPCLVSASQWQLHTHNKGRVNEPYFSFFKDNRNKLYRVGGHGNVTVSNSQWHHVAFVYRNFDDVRLFVDGELTGRTNKFRGDIAMFEKNVQIGCHANGNCVRAKFDDLKIWERDLSDDDIKTVYKEKNKSTY